jgi:hypothetical protein
MGINFQLARIVFIFNALDAEIFLVGRDSLSGHIIENVYIAF